MRRLTCNTSLLLLALAASLLVAGCRAEATPTPSPTPTPLPTPTSTPYPDPDYSHVSLVRNCFSADLPISMAAGLSGFQSDEEIEIVLVASDGEQAPLGTVTASFGGYRHNSDGHLIRSNPGMASFDIRHDGLAEGTYSIRAIGDQGSKASAVLFVE